MEIMKDWLTLPKLFQIWHISREMQILKEIMSYKVLHADRSVSQTALIFFAFACCKWLSMIKVPWHCFEIQMGSQTPFRGFLRF